MVWFTPATMLVSDPNRGQRIATTVSVAGAIVLLSLLTVFVQVKIRGLSWQESDYAPHLERVATGAAAGPAQYRWLSAVGTVAVFRAFDGLGVPSPERTGLLAIRIVQNCVLFLLALVYYRRLGASTYLAVLGLMALAWGMTQSNHQPGLAIPMYTELILFLLVALAALSGQVLSVLILFAIGALNRETAVFLPAFAALLPGGVRSPRNLLVMLGGIGMWLTVVLAIRWVAEVSSLPGIVGAGMPMHNMVAPDTWLWMIGTAGPVPLIALAGYSSWHDSLKPVAVAMSIWILVHFFVSDLSRFPAVLAPQILVFLPGAMCAIGHVGPSEHAATGDYAHADR